MKKWFLTLTLISTCFYLYGQNDFSGKIKYLMEVSDNPLGNIEIDIATDGSSYVLDMSLMAIPVSRMVYNSRTKSGYIAELFNLDEKPKAAYLDPKDLDQAPEGLNVDKIIDIKGKHEINGYKCKKKMVYLKGHEDPVSIFYAKNIKGLKNKDLPNSDYQALVDGLIIKIINPTEEGTMTIWVEEIDFTSPDPEIFNHKIPSKYKEVSLAELGSQ